MKGIIKFFKMKSDLADVFYDDFYGVKWETPVGSFREITWSIEDKQLMLPNGEYIESTASLSEYASTIQEAFFIWDNAIDRISFIESHNGNSADITLSATTLDVDGSLGEWNYAYDASKHITKAIIRLNSEELDGEWLATTVMHEIGNILGLGDIQPSDAIKSVQEDPFVDKFEGRELWQDDKSLLELIYQNDIQKAVLDMNDDGFVDEVINYQMWTASGGINLRNRRGKIYSEETSRKWDAVKAVEVESGFAVLLEGHRNKSGKFKVLYTSEEGVIGIKTPWLSGNRINDESYDDLFALDFTDNSEIGF